MNYIVFNDAIAYFAAMKSFDGMVTHDVQGLSRGTKNLLTASYFGIRGAKVNYAGQIKNINKTGLNSLGRTPCLFGECGIPMDLNDKKVCLFCKTLQHRELLLNCYRLLKLEITPSITCSLTL